MPQPAARLTDMHACPMVTVLPTVLIGGLPAARMGDLAVCVGPPDDIVLGAFNVLIGGQPAARMGDLTAHGGVIVLGCFNVLLG